MSAFLRRSWFAVGLPGNGAWLGLGVENGKPWWIVLGGVGVIVGAVHVWRIEP